jgi:non-ribosomal peptide synthetase component F
MNTHQGICNNLLWKQEQCALTATDSLIQRAPLSFDASIEEIFLPLMSGGRVVVARPEGHKDSA